MEYGLIGEKLGHSWSPEIHGMLAGYDYRLREVPPEQLDVFLDARDFRGLNVTVPYKRAVMPHCAHLTDVAREVGSVNAIRVEKDGSLTGHNTDIGGFIGMVRASGLDVAGRVCAVLGSGGTSRTAKAALSHLGAKEIRVVSRSGPYTYEQLAEEGASVDLLVNATPVGMFPNVGKSPVSLSALPNLRGVIDVIYNPECTELVLSALDRGILCATGLSMLVGQAREAAEWFTGAAIDPAADERICAEIRARTLNLVLVGMPGCGKSTLGARLSEKLGRPLLDADALIEARAGMTIPELFKVRGEEAFRALETQVLREVAALSGRVIATGGGAVTRPENVRALRQNGRICFLRRDLALLPRDGRPLSSQSEDAVARLWRERREAYLAAADFIVDNDAPADAVAQRVEAGFRNAAKRGRSRASMIDREERT